MNDDIRERGKGMMIKQQNHLKQEPEQILYIVSHFYMHKYTICEIRYYNASVDIVYHGKCIKWKK